MKIFQVGIRNDYGREYYMTLFTGKRYSLLQAAVDVGELSKWNEQPYIQISSGYGKLFSFLFTISKFGFAADFCARNWRDELFYVQPDELKQGE
jgi:hypothetical protein